MGQRWGVEKFWICFRGILYFSSSPLTEDSSGIPLFLFSHWLKTVLMPREVRVYPGSVLFNTPALLTTVILQHIWLQAKKENQTNFWHVCQCLSAIQHFLSFILSFFFLSCLFSECSKVFFFSWITRKAEQGLPWYSFILLSVLVPGTFSSQVTATAAKYSWYEYKSHVPSLWIRYFILSLVLTFLTFT